MIAPGSNFRLLLVAKTDSDLDVAYIFMYSVIIECSNSLPWELDFVVVIVSVVLAAYDYADLSV